MGFLDNFRTNKKEKLPKLDRSRRPQPNVSRAPVRPPPQPPNPVQQPLSAPTSIFGSLRRVKGGVATSTPKKPATFYADLETKTGKKENQERTKKIQGKKEDTVITGAETVITRRVDNNGNITTEPATIRDGANLHVGVAKRRGKENVEKIVTVAGNNNKVEYRRVVSSRPEKVKSSTLSLQNLLRNQPKTGQNQASKPKRPVTVAVPSNVSVRRGHKEGQGHPDNISRTSSITNLESLEANLQGQQGKGAKPRKAASKERIDKQTQDGKKVTKNNNKLEPPCPPLPPAGQPLLYSTTDSLQEAELHQLRKNLREMADEKSSLALQLGEHRGQLNVLQKEILELKSFQEESNLEMEKLREDNTALRNRLRDVVHSPLSDNEKQQLLFESRHHSSAPASIATNVADDNGGDATTCTTPDWDKHSSGNVSEVSVACLQDKINQMQETHYSTNEELQATLQELTDLQRQLTELQQENERLNEEKTLMFDSLCRQTERLNDSRQEVEKLKQFIYRERSDETGVNQFENVVEREQRLVELLRSAQEEREQLLLKLEQVQAELHDSRTGNIDKTENINQLTERVGTLECTLDAKHAEHKQIDQELAQAKDQCSGKQIEINRLSDLLENARTKINELEQDRTLIDKSELDELLDNARKEKDQLESEVTYLKEQLARSKNELEKLKEQVFVLQEECKVTRNNAKTTQSDLEYKCEKLITEKNALGEQLQQFQEAVNELQVQVQCHLEDKRQLSAVLSETQRNMSEAEQKNLNLENELQELKKLRAEENDEWTKFQSDLLTSVRVANDFKTEAQEAQEKIVLENKSYRERVRLLEGQLEKLKGEKTTTATQTDIILTPQIISVARNLDPSRLSLLDHSSRSSSHDPSSPTSSMDKLFPILGRERKSKSKENIADIPSSRGSETSSKRSKSRGINEGSKSLGRSSGSSVEPKKENKPTLKKSKSKDDLAMYAVEEPKKENKAGFLKRNKSRDDLQNTTDIDSKNKGSRGFLRWNWSKDNLDHYANEGTTSSSKEKKGVPKKHSQDNLDQPPGITTLNSPERAPIKDHRQLVDKPRKSKDSVESSSDSNKSDPKLEFFSKFIKKREKKPPNRSKITSHPKFMSVEEELLLKSLDSWYDNIDQNIPDEFLSEEDRAVKKLKILYEDDMLKEKPVAHKPKENLAISKPLLNSVVLNPKLEQIFRDPKLPVVDPEVRESALEDVCSVVNEEYNEPSRTDGSRFKIRSAEVFTGTGAHKSKSLDDINIFEGHRTESELAPVLYRAVDTENLSTEKGLAIRTVPFDRPFSDIQPNDSVSNPRYSEKYHVSNELPKPNIYINYENLDEIVNKIPKDVPHSKLTEGEKFALKLKHALEEAEKKTTLKKLNRKKQSIRGLEISVPTPESVQKNWKLKEIILNPGIKKAQEPTRVSRRENIDWKRKRHSTDISSDLGSPQEVHRQKGLIKPDSKSYEDISFSFVPENTLLNMYYGDKVRISRFTSDTSSSSQSFTSAEFNLDTGNIVQKFDIPVQLQQGAGADDEEDLLYNETLNKMKNKEAKEKRPSKEALAQLKRELSNQESDEEIHHPKILDARDKYKSDIKDMLKRMEQDELRKSLRKQRVQDDLNECITRQVIEMPKNESDGNVARSGDVYIRPAPAATETIHDFVQHENEDIAQKSSGAARKVDHPKRNKEFKITYAEERTFQTAEFEDHSHSLKIDEVSYEIQAVEQDNRFIFDEAKSIPSLDRPSRRHKDYWPDNIELPGRHSGTGSPNNTSPLYVIGTHNDDRSINQNRINEPLHVIGSPIHPIDLTRWFEPTPTPTSQKIVVENVDDQLPQEDTVKAVDISKKLALENVRYQLPSASSIADERLDATLGSIKPLGSSVSTETQLQPTALVAKDTHAINLGIEGPADKTTDLRYRTHYAQGVIIENVDFQVPSANDPCPETNLVQNFDISDPAERTLHDSSISISDVKLEDQPLVLDDVSSSSSSSEEDIEEALNLLDSVVYRVESPDIQSPIESDKSTSNSPLHLEKDQQEHWNYYVVDEAVPEVRQMTDDCDYKEILRENHFGVTSPLELRHTYRTVVKEYKSKFPPEHEDVEIIAESSEGSDLEYSDDFIDEFFKPVKGFAEEDNFNEPIIIEEVRDDQNVNAPQSPSTEDDSVTIRHGSGAIARIDKEMQDIMDKYLHTRASLLVKKVHNETEPKEKDIEQKITNLKKYSNFEDLQEIDNKRGAIEETHLAQPAIVIEDEDTPAESRNSSQYNDDEPLSLQDLQFIEEMKAKYTSVDTISTSSDSSSSSTEPGLAKAEVDDKHLKYELKPTKTRPLSDINESDLLLIERISKETLDGGSAPLQNVVVIEEIQDHGSIADVVNSKQNIQLLVDIPPLPASPAPKKDSNVWQADRIISIITRESATNTPDVVTEDSEKSVKVSKVAVEEGMLSIVKNDHIIESGNSKKYSESLIPTRKGHLPPSLRPKQPLKTKGLPFPQSTYSNVVFRNNPHMSSSQENQASIPVVDKGSYKRSDLIFKETIFVPKNKSPDSPKTPTYKQDSHFKESIFVSNQASAHNMNIEPSFPSTTAYSSKIPTWRKSDPIISKDNIPVSAANPKPFAITEPKSQSYIETLFIPKGKESPLLTQSNRAEARHSFTSEVNVNFNRHSTMSLPETIISDNNSGSLKKGFMDTWVSSYKPVYSTTPFVSKNQGGNPTTKTGQESLPSQDSSTLAGITGSTVAVASVISRNDFFHNMTDSNENFSETKNKQKPLLEEPKIFSNPNFPSDVVVPREIPEDKPILQDGKDVPSQDAILVEESKAYTDILKTKYKELSKPKQAPPVDATGEYEGNAAPFSDSTKMSESGKEPSLADSSSEATISIGTKNEELNITQPTIIACPVLEDDVEEVPRDSNDLPVSDVNLFQMDSHTSYDSYMELFKSKESKDFDDLRGKKPSVKGFAGFAFVEEIVVEDEGSVNTRSIDDDSSNEEARPKIVDFVPLDDKTTPFFTKEGASYDTLERERTYHVLGQAATISEVKSKENIEEKEPEVSKVEVIPEALPEAKPGTEKSDINSSVEVLAKHSSSISKSSSHTSTSRTSFSQAKKLFEALAEANKEERPKSAINSKSSAKYGARDAKSLEHLKPTASASSKEGIIETGYLQKSPKGGN